MNQPDHLRIGDRVAMRGNRQFTGIVTNDHRPYRDLDNGTVRVRWDRSLDTETWEDSRRLERIEGLP